MITINEILLERPFLRTSNPFAGELKKAIVSTASLVPGRENIDIEMRQTLADGTYASSEDVTLDRLETVLDLNSTTLFISFHSKEDRASLWVTGYTKHLTISASADRADLPQAIVRGFSEALALKPTQQEEEKDPFIELTKRVESLEGKITSTKERLKCFLSYRFDPAVEGLAQKLERFLTLVDVDVITGAGYEPRPIVEKVREKLGSPDLDFVVLLISQHGESMWTRDEITTANSRGVPVIPIVEAGAKFEPGLFGDLEYIRFTEGHIEESFIKLLEALKFIRLQSPEPKSVQ
jgi:hypothetical protein